MFSRNTSRSPLEALTIPSFIAFAVAAGCTNTNSAGMSMPVKPKETAKSNPTLSAAFKAYEVKGNESLPKIQELLGKPIDTFESGKLSGRAYSVPEVGQIAIYSSSANFTSIDSMQVVFNEASKVGSHKDALRLFGLEGQSYDANALTGPGSIMTELPNGIYAYFSSQRLFENFPGAKGTSFFFTRKKPSLSTDFMKKVN